MKCPKCQYISFDSAERCRNCGFEFALAVPDADLPLRPEPEAEGPPRDFAYRGQPAPQAPARGAGARGARAPTPGAFDLPLFSEPVPGVDDTPLIKVPATPRAPLAVRRPAGDTPRRVPTATPDVVRRPPVSPEPEQALDFGPDAGARTPSREAPGDEAVARRGDARAAGARQVAKATSAVEAGPWSGRLVAGLIDLAILAAIDGLVVYFTLRLTGLGLAEIRRLPVLPLTGFFAVLNGGYLVGFTAASGQTIGKMLTGLRVVTESGERVPLGHAIVRAPLWALSVLPLGLGCLPALTGDGRALHDRLANTRVVRA
jgi:uncharacterized RDD family membrane protein YckC